jgi:hypothetical protein
VAAKISGDLIRRHQDVAAADSPRLSIRDFETFAFFVNLRFHITKRAHRANALSTLWLRTEPHLRFPLRFDHFKGSKSLGRVIGHLGRLSNFSPHESDPFQGRFCAASFFFCNLRASPALFMMRQATKRRSRLSSSQAVIAVASTCRRNRRTSEAKASSSSETRDRSAMSTEILSPRT